MKKDFKFNFEELKNIVNKFEKEKLNYFVFGGWAYDGINNELNEHEDLDLVMFIEDKEKIKKILSSEGYKTRENINKLICINKKLKIEIRFIYNKEKYYEIKSNLCLDKISKEAFETINKTKINNFEFRIIPNEMLTLYKDGHIKKNLEKNRRVNDAIQKISQKCKKLNVLNQERFYLR